MYNVQEQTSDLWLKIDQLHLNYLKSEENTKKIDIRKNLEGFVHHYLCLVPQDRKFCSNLTSEIIWRSARWVPHFSAVKAATAFQVMEKYAANLLNQPWRKEFKEIKQYGGFYKHHVERFLNGAEKMFYQMGYLSTGRETLVLHGPVNQDAVTTVARDCILAYVECQIVVSIVQGVSAQFPCTWEEALDFRRDHVGTPEQAIRALIYLKNQMQYQMQNYHATTNVAPAYSFAPQTPAISSVHQQGYNYHQQFHSLFPDHHHHPSLQTPSLVQPPSAHHYGSNFNVHPSSLYQPRGCYSPKSVVALGDHHYPNYTFERHDNGLESPVKSRQVYSLRPADASSVSPAEFSSSPPPLPERKRSLQVGTPLAPMCSTSVDHNFNMGAPCSSLERGHGGAIPLTIKQFEEECRRKARLLPREEMKSSLETWDQVHEQLEDLSYGGNPSNQLEVSELLLTAGQQQLKLQGHRQQHRKTSGGQETAGFQQDRITPTGIRNDLDRECEPLKPPPRSRTERKQHSEMGGKNARSVDVSRSDLSPPRLPEKSKGLRSSVSKTDSLTGICSPRGDEEVSFRSQDGTPENGKWQCHACTYLNDRRLAVCDICAKSKSAAEPSGVGGSSTSLPRSSGSKRSATSDEWESNKDGDSDALRRPHVFSGCSDPVGARLATGADEEYDGIECRKCTLVNDPRVKTCDACGASLHFASLPGGSSNSSTINR